METLVDSDCRLVAWWESQKQRWLTSPLERLGQNSELMIFRKHFKGHLLIFVSFQFPSHFGHVFILSSFAEERKTRNTSSALTKPWDVATEAVFVESGTLERVNSTLCKSITYSIYIYNITYVYNNIYIYNIFIWWSLKFFRCPYGNRFHFIEFVRTFPSRSSLPLDVTAWCSWARLAAKVACSAKRFAQ